MYVLPCALSCAARSETHPEGRGMTRPQHELKCFEKVSLKSGETRELTFTLDADAFSF
ncbi:MAG: fibronectin type III-like domain-contianing protein [Muribaculaceae bacterium]